MNKMCFEVFAQFCRLGKINFDGIFGTNFDGKLDAKVLIFFVSGGASSGPPSLAGGGAAIIHIWAAPIYNIFLVCTTESQLR